MNDYKYTVLSSDGEEFGLFMDLGHADVMRIALKARFDFLGSVTFSVVRVSELDMSSRHI